MKHWLFFFFFINDGPKRLSTNLILYLFSFCNIYFEGTVKEPLVSII